MNNFFQRVSNERGESQMGLLIGALVIGGLIAAFTSLQSCIYNTKEARTSRVKEATYEANKPKNNWAPARPYEGQGYQVTY